MIELQPSHRISPLLRALALFGGVGVVVMGLGFAVLWIDAIITVVRDGTALWNRLLLAPVLVVGSWIKARDFLGAAWSGMNIRTVPRQPPWRARAR